MIFYKFSWIFFKSPDYEKYFDKLEPPRYLFKLPGHPEICESRRRRKFFQYSVPFDFIFKRVYFKTYDFNGEIVLIFLLLYIQLLSVHEGLM